MRSAESTLIILDMSTYILVHGAWHGGWCWNRIVAGLERDSHRVMAPDLRSQGIDRTPVGEVTLDLWTQQIADLVQAQSEPVVLVGHSRGGIVISEVAERLPDRVRTLVYVSAFLLENGKSLQNAADEDKDSLVGPAMIPASDGKSVTLREEALRELFYGLCSDADVALARALLVPEPVAPLGTPLRLTESRFGRVPRLYVECSADRAMTLAMQRRMQAALPCQARITLDADHSPFFSRSDELIQCLQSL
jgi:pimeloyl-ACP methyl ester carboxylesterase